MIIIQGVMKKNIPQEKPVEKWLKRYIVRFRAIEGFGPQSSRTGASNLDLCQSDLRKK